MRVARNRWPERRAKHEIYVDFESPRPTESAGVGQPPLATRVLTRRPLGDQTEATENLLESLYDAWPLVHHGGAVRCADVVQINVNRESGKVEDKQVERSSSLECHAVAEERMGAYRA